MIPGFFAVTAGDPAPPYPPYIPTPYAIAVPRVTNVADWASSTTDSSATLTPDPSWESTDYVVVLLTGNTATVTPPTELSLLGQFQSAGDSNLWQRVYGGFRGSAASWTWTFAPGGTHAMIATAVAGIDPVNPFVSVGFKGVPAAGNRRNVRADPVNVASTDGLFSVALYTANANPTAAIWVPSVPLNNGFVWTNLTPVRAARVGQFPIAEGLTKIKVQWIENSISVSQAIGGAVVLKRAGGVRPTLTPTFAPLESYLSSFAVGYAWAALRDGVVVAGNAAGWARNPSASTNPSVAFSADTKIAVASISKIVTELAVRKLIEDGMLAMEDTLASRLPGYSFGSNVAGITVRQLLEMTSGIAATFNINGAHPATLASWLSGNSSTNPGEWYNYQNGNFAALHEIIGQVTGVPYADWTQANVLDPLGIVSAGTVPDPDGPLAYRTGSTTMAVPVTVPATAVGGWQMSLNDLVKLTRGLRYPIVLSPESLLEMLNDRYRMSPTFGPRGEMHQHDGLLLDGSNRGVRAQVLRGVDGYDIVAVTNTYDMSGTSLLPSVKECLASI